MPIAPPFTIPVGQELVYCFASTFTSAAGANCSASITTTTGQNNQTWSGPLGGPYTTQTNWSNFFVPPVLSLPGVVVHGIYPYIIFSNFFQYAQITSGGIDGNDLHTTPNGNHSLFFTHSNTNLATIPAITAFFHTQGTLTPPGGGLFGGPITEFVTTSFVGIAVYATIVRPPELTVRRGYYGQ